MPWRETSILNERIKFVIAASKQTQSFSSLCAEYGISRQTGYRWLRRFKETGEFTELADRSHKPKSFPQKTPDEIEEQVVALRKKYGWGAKKLDVKLREIGIALSVSTINRILRREGLMRYRDAHQPALQRFEREHPNELWQMDFKGEYDIKEGTCYPLSILDDHSRFALGLYALSSMKGATTYKCIVSTMETYGVPDAILMDHGTPWWNVNSGGGITWLSIQLVKQGIKIYHSAFRHPQTQGKVEAFHHTLSRAFRHFGRPTTLGDSQCFFDSFVHTYNYERPHEGIGMELPDQRYKASEKKYIKDPPDWVYPDDLIVVPVNSQGSIYYNKKRAFVGQPLAFEKVALEQVGDTLLVLYQDTFVRQIDTRTGKSKPFIRPAKRDLYIR